MSQTTPWTPLDCQEVAERSLQKIHLPSRHCKEPFTNAALLPILFFQTLQVEMKGHGMSFAERHIHGACGLLMVTESVPIAGLLLPGR